jgi:hypothetical protein
MSINSLALEVGVAFILAYWGGGLALGFKADPRRPLISQEAIQRCFNWAFNTGVTRGRLHYVYDKSAIGYVFTSHADLLKGLIAQFRAEIIMSREVPPIKDDYDDDLGAIIEYDEALIERMATERATRFMEERVVYENFLSNLTTSLAPVYEVGAMTRVGAPDSFLSE